MKKFLTLLLLVVFAFSLVGCKSSGGGEQGEKEQPLKVAMLLPGPISDQGWNATAYQGLKKIEEQLGAETTYAENIAQSDMEEFFRTFAEQGYSIVFGHGFQFGDAAKKVAEEFPNTKFVITSASVTQEPNVASLNNDNRQQGFLAGALSALITKSNTVAAIAGMEIPSITAFVEGFEAGAKHAKPDVKVLTTYTGDFKDAAKAKELTFAMINQGADVIAHDADAAGLGVLEAAKEKNVLALGAITDQYELAPEVVVTSALSDLSEAIFKLTESFKNGEKFEAKEYILGIKEGTVGLSSYRDFEAKIGPDVIEKVKQISDDLAEGKIGK